MSTREDSEEWPYTTHWDRSRYEILRHMPNVDVIIGSNPDPLSVAYKQGWTAAREDDVEGIESYKRQVAYWRGVTGKQRVRAEKAEAELAQIRANRDTLAAMIQRLDKFLNETGTNISWKHGAVHTAIELIKDLRERLEDTEARIAELEEALNNADT